MAFIKTPLSYEDNTGIIARCLEERVAMIDNFIELIVFSPKGSFIADDDLVIVFITIEQPKLIRNIRV